MKTKLFVGLGVTFFIVSSLSGSIIRSKHDLGNGAGGDNAEACVYCHTPHASNVDFTNVPLWNKPSTGTTFTMYGASAEGVPGKTIAGTETDASPSGATLACLSCHDGVSAINSVVNAPGSGGYNLNGTLIGFNDPTYQERMGTSNVRAVGAFGDLTNDHPVSIPYVEGAASLKPKNTQISGWQGATTINDLLRDGKVQCVSCHDPHYPNWGTFRRTSNNGSELCKTCHDK
ncbi:cytochrome c family protein [Hydrogenimonas sp.]|nr:cytochrome c family protein [Hydrogenimonas sp.]